MREKIDETMLQQYFFPYCTHIYKINIEKIILTYKESLALKEFSSNKQVDIVCGAKQKTMYV